MARDRIDGDHGWAAFDRDTLRKFRAIGSNAFYATADMAYNDPTSAMQESAKTLNAAFRQNDEVGAANYFFAGRERHGPFEDHSSFVISPSDRARGRGNRFLAVAFQNMSGLFVRLLVDKVCRVSTRPLNFRSSTWTAAPVRKAMLQLLAAIAEMIDRADSDPQSASPVKRATSIPFLFKRIVVGRPRTPIDAENDCLGS